MDDSNGPDPSARATDESGAGLPEATLNTDTMFEALAHERRRYVLYSLFDDEERSLQRLATKLAAWEASTSEADVPEEEIERVYASLYHAHVPKLVDLGIVAFDPREETITTGPSAKPVLDVLDQIGASSSIDLEQHARVTEND